MDMCSCVFMHNIGSIFAYCYSFLVVLYVCVSLTVLASAGDFVIIFFYISFYFLGYVYDVCSKK